MTRSYTNYFFYTGTPQQHGELGEEEKHELLLKPLSETQQENAVSYIINLTHLPNWQVQALTTTLDEIEQMTQDRDARLAVLTSANELGQTPFLLTLKTGYADSFDILKDRLRKWGGEDYANDWLKDFLAQRLRIIDGDLYSTTDVIKQGPSVLAYAFPGKMFDRLLDLQQKFDHRSLRELANYIVEQLSMQIDGTTAMHDVWQSPVRRSAPRSVGDVKDYLAPVIARFDKRFGTEIAVDMTARLLSAKDGKGNLPLDRSRYDREPTARDFYLGGFLLNLRKELGSPKKFEEYMTKAIRPILPKDFSDNPGNEPKPETPARPTGRRRGATCGP